MESLFLIRAPKKLGLNSLQGRKELLEVTKKPSWLQNDMDGKGMLLSEVHKKGSTVISSAEQGIVSSNLVMTSG